MSLINPGMSKWERRPADMAQSGKAICAKRLEQTLLFVQNALAGQKDKSGAPLWVHSYHVYLRLRKHPKISEAGLHAALLHDIIEDTDITLEELWEVGYPWKTLKWIELLTRDSKQHPYYMDYKTYINNLITWSVYYEDMEPILIKLADLYDNTRPEREFPGRQTLMGRYTDAISQLEKFAREEAKLIHSGEIKNA